MGNNIKSVGIAVGVVVFICGLVLAILIIAQPALLIQEDWEEWTLINILNDGNGLWMNGDGDLKIDSSEGYEVGDVYESGEGFTFGEIFVPLLIGATFMAIGFMFLAAHLKIE